MAPTRTPKQPSTSRRPGARVTAAPTPRRTPSMPSRRRKPEPESNAKKVFGAVSAALPGLIEKAGAPAKKAKPSGRKSGAGLAILGAAGAGFAALKNRDKLPAKLGGRPAPEPVAPYTPVSPVVVTPPAADDDAVPAPEA